MMIKEKNRFIVYILAVISVLTLYSPTTRAQDSQKPNFIFFITDDIGWRDLGCYGNTLIKTPNIDELAKRSLKFENVYLTTSSCSPSRCSIISGRYPHNTGAPELHDTLPAGQVMFPKLLKESGYYTALSGKNHMGPQVKNAFDLISAGKGPGGEGDWVSLLQDRPKNKPFFFWFASHDAHRDWQFNDKGTNYDPDDIKVPPMMFDGPETRKDLAGYYHEISRADYYLGQLVKELEKQGLMDNTYIIFMSDNGSPFPRNKTRLYHSGVKTPFIMYGPKIKGGENNALISSIDIAPTILDIASVRTDKRIQGKSFYSILNGAKKSIRDFVFAEHNWHVFQAYERMVQYGDWLYIRNGYPERRNLAAESTKMFPAGKELWAAYEQHLTKPEQEDIFLMPRPSEELYNVKSDPYQFNNIAGVKKYQKIRSYLSAVMNTWIEQTGDSKPVHPTPDRDDVDGKRLKSNRKWTKGDKPGERNNAVNINQPGPVLESDL